VKRTYFIVLLLALGIGAMVAACGGGATNGNTSMNMNAMNHNSMMNSNSMNMNGMNHNSMPMNSNMNMSSMMSGMKSDPDAASQPYDLQFIDTMTHHHEGAVRMSEMALMKSQNDELKKFAQKIIDDQKKEIAQMKQWRDKWYPGKPPAKNMEMPGMMDSMKMMTSEDMKKMEAASGKDFDLHFLEMMTPHHEGAVKMSQEALTKAEHPEIKTLAGKIIKAQEAEIKMMNDWKAKWSK
jgi:uncharacterized protein (DUF305 family)